MYGANRSLSERKKTACPHQKVIFRRESGFE
jgi:hypothetical protein